MHKLLRPILMVALAGAWSVGACSDDGSNNSGKGGSGGAQATGGTGGRGGTGGSSTATGGTGGSIDAAGADSAAIDGGGARDAGSDGSPTDAAAVGTTSNADGSPADTASAAKMAEADMMPLVGTPQISGKVTFVEVAGGVQVTYMVEGCPAGKHLTHIHAGGSCATTQSQGVHWDGKRGDGIGGDELLTCGADGKGMLVYTRPTTPPPTKWSIGDGSKSDVIGHVVIIHGGMNSGMRHSCGAIKAVK